MYYYVLHALRVQLRGRGMREISHSRMCWFSACKTSRILRSRQSMSHMSTKWHHPDKWASSMASDNFTLPVSRYYRMRVRISTFILYCCNERFLRSTGFESLHSSNSHLNLLHNQKYYAIALDISRLLFKISAHINKSFENIYKYILFVNFLIKIESIELGTCKLFALFFNCLY